MKNEMLFPEIFAEVVTKAKERFATNSKQYHTIMKMINFKEFKGSQYFFNNFANSILPEGQRIICLEDMERIQSDYKPFFENSYTDSTELVLRTSKTSNRNNKYILDDLVEQINETRIHGATPEFYSEKPLILRGLEIFADPNPENPLGLLLKIGKNTKMWNDKRFAYSNNGRQISFGKKPNTIKVSTRENGLTRLFIYKGEILASDHEELFDSYVNGTIITTTRPLK